MRFVHISDLHFGPHYRPVVGESLLEYLIVEKCEALVITGDFTQRATREEFADASRFLARLRSVVPQVIVCPGNHDIALFRVWERIFYPFRLYKKYIHPQLNQVADLNDARIVALNSVRPLKRLVEGKLSWSQLSIVNDSLSEANQKLFRVLALHHPPGIAGDRQQFSSREAEFVKLCIDKKVDLVLSGHVHVSHVLPLTPKKNSSPERCPLLVGCGTTTSGRGRDTEKDQNTFRLIEGDSETVSISTLKFNSLLSTFETHTKESFPKPF